MNFSLKGKVSLVTGACRGIGRVCAEVLLERGSDQVCICCRNYEHIQKTSLEIENRYGLSVKGFEADLSKPSDIRNLVRSILKKGGHIDILVVNTGTPSPGSFLKCKTSDWKDGINLCLNSTIQLCQEIIPSMKENKFGRIIILTSIFAKEPDFNFVISSTLRSALVSLTKCLATELASFGITANAICQGYVDTPLLREVAKKQTMTSKNNIDSVFKEWKNFIPLKRFAKPEEVAYLVGFLASDLAGYITGTSIAIDGGILKSIL